MECQEPRIQVFRTKTQEIKMAVATQLRSVPPSRSPDRQRLAEAIEHHATAQRRLAAIRAASEHSADLLYGENGAIDASKLADVALEEAKKDESRHLAAVAIGEADADADANPVKAALAAVEKAHAALDAARKTKNALEDQQLAADAELVSAKRVLDECISTVLRSEAGAVIDRTLREAAGLQADLGAKRATLSFLKSAFSWQERELAKPIHDFLAAPAYPWEWNNKISEHPAIAPWARAREALARDADAALPT
jgi:hypothetical protein